VLPLRWTRAPAGLKVSNLPPRGLSTIPNRENKMIESNSILQDGSELPSPNVHWSTKAVHLPPGALSAWFEPAVSFYISQYIHRMAPITLQVCNAGNAP
jgi:hypothetical protein